MNVTKIQAALAAHGYDLSRAVSGVYDAKTAGALAAYRRTHGLGRVEAEAVLEAWEPPPEPPEPEPEPEPVEPPKSATTRRPMPKRKR